MFGRALHNGFIERWRGPDRALAEVDASEGTTYRTAVRDEDFDKAVVWAGECVDLVRVVEPAAQIVRRISAGAEEHIADAAHMLPTHFSRG